MTEPAFLVLAAVTVIGSIMALEARDLVYGAVALGVAFLGMAGLFILLDASYVAAFQIAVYIGAVVILILFTVMLVGPAKGEAQMELKRVSLLAAVLVATLIGMGGALASAAAFPGSDVCGGSCDIQSLSRTLLIDYGTQLELLSLVLAAAVIGALTLAKAEKKT
ncbi:NADH-quinone oxidoreductase subunit J [Candidatus Bathyarchaeota archaeon]|nr:MAG: NADH-quinone oxidoreductase subunit J [Candidatus Bathyarchaeota archaeon]TMI33027.1 MAG: NADH-quinone oxidoreductase subunit J [Candidatus Bathyarchaeota archaeon]